MKFKHYQRYNYKGLALIDVDVNECGCILGGDYIPIMCATHQAKFERIDEDRKLVEQALYKLYREINVIRPLAKPTVKKVSKKKKENIL